MASTRLYKYQTDAGTIGRVRSDITTGSITGNTEPAGAVGDAALFASASNPGSKRKKALNARGIILERTVGTAPNTFKRRTFAPVFTQASLAAIAIGAAVTRNGQEYTVASKVSEA